jgi:hypothetical protein
VVVGALSVNDPDGNGNSGLVLSLGGPDASHFALRNGALVFVGSSPDFESKPSYSVTVTSTDGLLVKSQSFTVNITNVNDAPTAANVTVSIAKNGSKAFASTDFGFADVEGHALSAVIITTLPSAGALTLNGTAVTANQSIAAADIAAGKLVYAPAANAIGTGYASMGFKVQDNGGSANGGVDTSSAANTLTFNVATATLSAGQLGSVTNLDVSSKLVLTSDVALKIGTGTGYKIRIYDDGGPGFRGDTNDNDQTIDVNQAAINAGRIALSADGKTITIDPQWDLDLSSKYRIEVDASAFVTQTGDIPVDGLSVSFGTVTPGTATSSAGKVDTDAASSIKMTATGVLEASKKWFYFGENGLSDIALVDLGDLGNAGYALVIKNYAKATTQSYDGIDAPPFNVSFDNFGEDDVIYIDSQVNDLTKQTYQPNLTPVYANPSKSNWGYRSILEFGKTGDFGAVGLDTANIGLTFEGLTDKTLYGQYEAIKTWTDPSDGEVYRGFADDWHKQSPAVIMA